MDSPNRVSRSSGTPKSLAQQGNLTGPARVLNDTVVLLHTSIQKWIDAYQGGVKLIQNIQSKNEGGDDFQSSCEKLGALVDVLRFQLSQMRSCATKLSNLKALNDINMKVGISWTFTNFGNCTSVVTPFLYLSSFRLL